MPEALVRAVLADDHPVFRYGVANLLAASGGIEVVASVENGSAALQAILQHAPDIAILDIAMPVMNGVAVVRGLAKAGSPTRAIMLSVYESRVYVDQAFQAGARGYVVKRSAFQSIVQAVRAVHAGGLYLDPALPERSDPDRHGPPRIDEGAGGALNARERDILRLVAFGFTSKEVADQLAVTPKAVETQKARACAKLGIASRAQVVQFAILQGWLQGEIPAR